MMQSHNPVTNIQENKKNDRGALEQPQLVSCGSQALTYSQHQSPSATISPSNNQPYPSTDEPSSIATNTAPTLQIPSQSTQRDSRFQENNTFSINFQRSDDPLANVVSDLEQANRSRSRSPDRLCHRHSQFQFFDSSDKKDELVMCMGTQTEEMKTDLDGENSEGADLSSLLSHVSEQDFENEKDDHFEMMTTGTSEDFRARRPAKVVIPQKDLKDDEFTNGDTVQTAELKDKPMRGLVYYLIYTVLMSGNLYAAYALFQAAPHVAIMQLTFMRGLVCTVMVLLMINRNAKAVLIDPVDCKTLPSLIFRCLQGGISVYISFSSINYFNVSTVGIVCSLKPIIACVMGVTILGETMTVKDVVCMIAVFIAVFLVIFGSQGSEAESMQSAPWALIALIAQPFLLAGGDIAMRKMKKMPESLCSAYQNVSLTLLASFYMFASGLSFDFIWTLSSSAWFYIVLSCALTVISQMVKAHAFKYSESSRLQKLSFLPNVWQFSIDLIILSVAFSTMQLTGFGLLVSFYVMEMTYSVVQSKMADKEFVANDQGYSKV